jgi:hypothetical protein
MGEENRKHLRIVRSCGWCEREAAVEINDHLYCGTCFLWIAVRRRDAEGEIRSVAAQRARL